MAEVPGATPVGAAADQAGAAPQGRSKDDVALELMKFVAVTTGYGRGGAPSAGFSSKPVARSAEEYADALLELFQRCRKVVNGS